MKRKKVFWTAFAVLLALIIGAGSYSAGKKSQHLHHYQVLINDKKMEVFTLSKLEIVSNGEESAVVKAPYLIAREKDIRNVNLILQKDKKELYTLGQGVFFSEAGEQVHFGEGEGYYEKPVLKNIPLAPGDTLQAEVTVDYENKPPLTFKENVKLKDSFAEEKK